MMFKRGECFIKKIQEMISQEKLLDHHVTFTTMRGKVIKFATLFHSRKIVNFSLL